MYAIRSYYAVSGTLKDSKKPGTAGAESPVSPEEPKGEAGSAGAAAGAVPSRAEAPASRIPDEGETP